jgi:undecaprenyl-diphosphatase
MVFAARLTGIFGGDPQKTTATMAVMQLGTLAAVLIYFFGDIWGISTAFVRDHWNYIFHRNRIRFSRREGGGPLFLSEEAWLGWLIIIGSIPIGVAGLLLKKHIEGPATKNLWFISIMMIAIAVLLFIAEKVGKQRKEMKHLGLTDALAQGLTQVLSLMPGASRSGSTMMGGLFAGQKRETAARFSFLLSIPAIAASGLLQLREATEILPDDAWTPLIAGTIASGIVGYLSIWFLLAFLRKNSMMIFIVYRIVLAVIILGLLWYGVIEAAVQ